MSFVNYALDQTRTNSFKLRMNSYSKLDGYGWQLLQNRVVRELQQIYLNYSLEEINVGG